MNSKVKQTETNNITNFLQKLVIEFNQDPNNTKGYKLTLEFSPYWLSFFVSRGYGYHKLAQSRFRISLSQLVDNETAKLKVTAIISQLIENLDEYINEQSN